MKKLLIAVGVILFSLAAYAQSSHLKVITFNVRYNNPSDSIYSWDNRKPMVFKVIQKYHPGIIGFQEVLDDQLRQISDALPGYNYSGVGRDDGKRKGEYSPIFFDGERFEKLDGATFWLSRTPEVPGSKSWNSACTRICTWVKLSDKKVKVFFVFNTHFDHVSEEARVESAKLIQRGIKLIAGNNNVILSGDFNSNKNGEAYKMLVSKEAETPMLDTRTLAGSNAMGPSYSFIGFPFAPPANDGIIDFIFISESTSLKVKSNKVIDYHKGGKYPSDHLPVITEFE